MARRAFTIVELLVVIGVIGVLAAILLPALRAARRQATSVVCASNLRQINQAALHHAQDHRGYLPVAGEIVARPNYSAGLNQYAEPMRDPNRLRYTYANCTSLGGFFVPVPLPAALAPYMGIKDLPFHDWTAVDQALNRLEFQKRFTCPATDSKSSKYDTGGDLTLVGQGTMMSLAPAPGMAILAWSSNSDFAFNEGVFGFHQDRLFASRRLGGNINKLNNPDKLALFTDAKTRAKQPYPWMRDPWICWTPNPYLTGPVTLADALENNGKAVDPTMFDTHRHQGRINVAFADGHVQMFRINSAELGQVYLLTR